MVKSIYKLIIRCKTNNSPHHIFKYNKYLYMTIIYNMLLVLDYSFDTIKMKKSAVTNNYQKIKFVS